MRRPLLLPLLLLLLPTCKPGEVGLSAKVAPYQNRPAIFLDGRPVAPILYALTDVPGGRRSWEEVPQHNIERFCNDGIRMFQVDVFLEQLWREDGALDLDYARRQVEGIRAVCPEAAVFFRFHVNAPRWWTARHPEENVRYAPSSDDSKSSDEYAGGSFYSSDDLESSDEYPGSGFHSSDESGYSPDITDGLSRLVEADPRNPLRTSLASDRWRSEAGEQLARFCRAFARTPAGQAVAGIQVACGVYGEWHQWGFLNWEADQSDPMTQHFRHWLREKYRDAATLQHAWNDPAATFDNAAVPGLAERGQHSGGNFRDPQREQRVIDYYNCQHERVADDILFFGRTVKEHWPRPVITGAFYGYFFSCFNRQAAGGHLALQKVLNSPDIDYLAGPQAYLPEAEQPGEPYRSRSLLLSMRLYGKLWLDEMDQQPRRTFAYIEGIKDNRDNYAAAVRENVAQLRRNLMFSLSKGSGLWFYDFGPAGMDLNARAERSPQWGSQGYWDHPEYHRVVRECKALADSALHRPWRSDADVLLVYDTEVNAHTKSLVADPDSVSLQLIDFSSLALYYSGAVFDPVHLDDLDRVDLAQYKCVIFANTFLLDEQDKKVIREKVARDGRHLVWLYAPGYSDGRTLDAGRVSEVTGMTLRSIPGSKKVAVAIAVAVGPGVTETLWGRAEPLFAVSDPQATVFGRFRGSALPALASKRQPEHTAWFSAVPLTDARSWRLIFGPAGVHFYTGEKSIVYAGNGLVTVHVKSGGTHTVALRNGRKVALALPAGPSTVVLDGESGRVLSGSE